MKTTKADLYKPALTKKYYMYSICVSIVLRTDAIHKKINAPAGVLGI